MPLFGALCGLIIVALRKESVDRNFDAMQIVVVIVVALRKESVDRNVFWTAPDRLLRRSLSARRAWIEIHNGETLSTSICSSLSARRAWIEIDITA